MYIHLLVRWDWISPLFIDKKEDKDKFDAQRWARKQTKLAATKSSIPSLSTRHASHSHETCDWASQGLTNQTNFQTKTIVWIYWCWNLSTNKLSFVSSLVTRKSQSHFVKGKKRERLQKNNLYLAWYSCISLLYNHDALTYFYENAVKIKMVCKIRFTNKRT